MTNRERFHAVMNGDGQIDRAPVLEWATWWGDTVSLWEQEGIPAGMDFWGLFRYFNLDLISQFWFPHRRPGCPQETAHGSGIIRDEEDYARVKPLLYPEDGVERMWEQLQTTLPLYNSGECIVWYTLEGFFWFPRTLFGIENHLYAFYDYPDLYHRICEDLLEWQVKTLDNFARYIKADFMTIAEDMSYNHGPMISQQLYNTFMLPYYRRLTPEIKKHGTRVFVDSDGDVSEPAGWFLEGGIEGILPLERQAGVDIHALQRRYPDLLLLGAFDKMSMLAGPEAIRAEFQRILPALRRGRYLPGVDHQTPPGVTLENYRYYVKLMHEYAVQACRDS